MGARVELVPIHAGDAPGVGAFLHRHLNSRIAAADWARALVPAWGPLPPNHGFMLLVEGAIAGVQLCFYSERPSPAGVERICNLAAFCVREDCRAHSLKLLRAALSQPGYSFTDLSPSGNVRPLNLRLGFRQLDTATALVPNAAFALRPGRGARLLAAPEEIKARLTGAERRIFDDHAGAAAARHLLLCHGGRSCYVIFRRDRRKGLPLFATLLHVGDRELFRRHGGLVYRHLLLRHGVPFTLAELRLVGERPRPSWLLPGHRPKMYLSATLGPAAVDYLYSELTCVAW